MSKRHKQCQRCGLWSRRGVKVCNKCGAPFERWRMNRDRIRLCHTLARAKGLSDEVYRLRLEQVGVESCKQLKQAQFFEFIEGLNRLPDAPVAKKPCHGSTSHA